MKLKDFLLGDRQEEIKFEYTLRGVCLDVYAIIQYDYEGLFNSRIDDVRLEGAQVLKLLSDADIAELDLQACTLFHELETEE